VPLPVFISGAVEGRSDEPVFRRIVEERGGTVHRLQVQNGKSALRHALPGYNAAAVQSPWLVLVDLDSDFECAGALVADWLPHPSRHMCFRVVVRQIESWLLADAERFAEFFAVRRSALPTDPDSLPDAKQTVVNLVARSRRKSIRLDMVPSVGSGRRVGPAYASHLINFVSDPHHGWRLATAMAHSRSLTKCVERFDALVARHRQPQ
jgi:hypothetical protein